MARTMRDGEGREPSWQIAKARWERSGLSVPAFCPAWKPPRQTLRIVA